MKKKVIIGLFISAFILFSINGEFRDASSSTVDFGWFSLVPPVVSIILAFISKDVIISLFFGIFAGGFVLHLADGSIFYAFVQSFLSIIDSYVGQNQLNTAVFNYIRYFTKIVKHIICLFIVLLIILYITRTRLLVPCRVFILLPAYLNLAGVDMELIELEKKYRAEGKKLNRVMRLKEELDNNTIFLSSKD